MNKTVIIKTIAFIVITTGFVVWVAFFDKNNLKVAEELDQTIEALEMEKQYYLDKITADSTVIRGLSDDKFIEKYAREHYLMKKAGEEIYIVKTK